MEMVGKILNFWFGDLQADNQMPKEQYKTWFKKSAETDQAIRDQFEAELLKAIASTEHWEKTPRGFLALIILFDQFSRNLFRNSPQSFAQDPQALALSLEALDAKIDDSLRPIERIFVYMPLMHSEILAHQKRGIECFERLVENAPPEIKEMAQASLDSAHQHCEIIEKFRRFPHRNQVLGRLSTPEEEEFLKQPGSSF